MNKNKRIYMIILLIILIALIIIAGLNIDKINNNKNNPTIETEANEYSNLNINKDELNIFYLNVGQGDSTLITINGYTMLIDSGNDSDGYYISQFLKAQNINKIDYFIVTHFDEDHMGGAYKILEELEIGILYTPNDFSENNTYEKFLKAVEDNNINIDNNLVASKEITYSLGDASWRVLNINGNNSNDSSIVVELNYKNTKYLFMGDATTAVEDNVEWDEVDVLKVGHHGSNSSTSKKFLETTKPKYAVISVGADNSYKLPKKDVIDRLINNNIIVYRTDEKGTIWLKSDGAEIYFDFLEYNMDGKGRKQANIFERKYCVLSFYKCTT